tara:strand:- start:11 stop:343 length:333 start_codon:yes stop_codon:yes gene_type:complete
MFNKSLIISLTIFFGLMIFTSVIKNKTRNLEKNIEKLNREVATLEKQIHNAEIDFIYLSSPEQLKKYLIIFNKENYLSFNFSRIFFSFDHYLTTSNKQTKIIKIKGKNEK